MKKNNNIEEQEAEICSTGKLVYSTRKWRSELNKMLKNGSKPEEMFYLLHLVINNGHSTFYETIVRSEEWKKWERMAYQKGFDYALSTETGWFSEGHWEAFIKFIRQTKK